MLRILKWVGLPVLAVALMSVDTSQAKADGFRFHIGVGGYGHHHHHHHNHGISTFRYRVYNPGYHSYYRGHHYARPHLDYHPPSLVPHRGHYHYMPGHFDLHYGPHYGHRYGHHYGY
ncbi:hypothetical protein [Roseimaritima sediminicola]|uniref:hypothetical protein n=1 Tax=Roseimaritima sediminicola TaxID=2662066 RepID=UPI0012982DB3|nr:hypothetical protein [Roseimaritima sediminicola]